MNDGAVIVLYRQSFKLEKQEMNIYIKSKCNEIENL